MFYARTILTSWRTAKDQWIWSPFCDMAATSSRPPKKKADAVTSTASEAAESEAASGSTGKLAEQTRVRLVGLEAFVDLNGQLGTLLSFDSSRGRWQVRLDSGQVKNVRVNNLVNIAQTVAPEEKPAKGLKRAAEAPCLKPQATPLRSKSKAAAKVLEAAPKASAQRSTIPRPNRPALGSDDCKTCHVHEAVQSTPVRVNEPGPESDLDLDALSARLDSVEGLEKAIQAHLFGVEERSRTSLDNKVQEIMRLLEEILETVKCKTAADLQTLGCLADFQKHFTCPPKPPKAGTEPPQSLRAPRKNQRRGGTPREVKPPEISPRFAELPALPFGKSGELEEDPCVEEPRKEESTVLQGVTTSLSDFQLQNSQSAILNLDEGVRTASSMDKVLSVSVGKKIYRRHLFKRVMWSCLEDESSSRMAWYYGYCMDAFIVFSVLLPLFESSQIGEADMVPMMAAMSVINLGFDVIFLIDLCFRFLAWPTMSHFLCNAYNVIDMFVLPSLGIRVALGVNISPTSHVMWSTLLLCFFPVLRLLKLLRRFQTFQVLLSAWWAVFEALPMLIFVLAIIALTFAAVLFSVEPRSNIADWGSVLWLTVVSMTGLGYGDLSPCTPEGKVCVSILIITSLLYLSIPFGILGSAFTLAWSQRDAVMAVRKLRKHLANHGFTSEDMRKLLQHFDLDHDAEISLVEFRTMINHVMIGFTNEEASDLFESLDFQQRGLIRTASFLTIVFPREFEECKQTYAEAPADEGGRSAAKKLKVARDAANPAAVTGKKQEEQEEDQHLN
eukprot:s2562_g11.t1